MNTPVTPLVQPDLDLRDLRHVLSAHAASALVMTYAGRTVGTGYHVTEIKSAQFAALDCGGNPDSWVETVLQVEDLPGPADQGPMSVGKFLSILGRVDTVLTLDPASRVTIEVSRTGEAMQVFDIADISVFSDRVTLNLARRPAICKPRHRAADARPAVATAASAASRGQSCCAPAALSTAPAPSTACCA